MEFGSRKLGSAGRANCWNGDLLTIAAGPPNQGLGGIYIHGSLICQVMPMTNQLTCRNGEIGKLTSRDVTFNSVMMYSKVAFDTFNHLPRSPPPVVHPSLPLTPSYTPSLETQHYQPPPRLNGKFLVPIL